MVGWVGMGWIGLWGETSKKGKTSIESYLTPHYCRREGEGRGGERRGEMR